MIFLTLKCLVCAVRIKESAAALRLCLRPGKSSGSANCDFQRENIFNLTHQILKNQTNCSGKRQVPARPRADSLAGSSLLLYTNFSSIDTVFCDDAECHLSLMMMLSLLLNVVVLLFLGFNALFV
jgi:hypothetical protein